MGFVIIGIIVAALVAATVWAKHRERDRVEGLLRAGAAGELHNVDIQGHERSNLGIAEASAHAQMRGRR